MANKLGRNEPCPCGSGKKYKRCCADRDAEEARAARAAGEGPPWARPDDRLPGGRPPGGRPPGGRLPGDHGDEVDIPELFREIERAGDALLIDSDRAAEAFLDALTAVGRESFDLDAPHGRDIQLCITLAPRCFGAPADLWVGLLAPRLSVAARALLAVVHATPPRLWRRYPKQDPFHVTPVTRFRPREVAATLSIAAAPDRAARCFFGWSFDFGGHTVLFNFIGVHDPDMLAEVLDIVEEYEREGHLDEESRWALALELIDTITLEDGGLDDPFDEGEDFEAPYEQAWRERVARDAHVAALNHAVRALLGSRPAIRATARATASRLVELADGAVSGGLASVDWATRLGVEVELSVEMVLETLGLDPSGHAPGLDREALSRHPLALLAVDPEGAGLPAVDPRMPIGAAAAVAQGKQRKALDKALTDYEREVRFAHLIARLFARVEGRGALAWRYTVLQVGGFSELLGGALNEQPLSRLGLPKGASSRLASALRAGGASDGEPTLGDLPSGGPGLANLRGVGEKTQAALTDALEELFGAWRWQRAGVDRASFVAARPAEDAARNTLSAGLDQLDALFS